MNIWTQKSIELANQQNYLDLLYKVYPLSANLKREMSENVKVDIARAITSRDNEALLDILIAQTKSKKIVFPIKDSYVAYLKHDQNAIARNPNTVNRLTGILYEMGYEKIIDNSTAPKETNRQIGPLFNYWLRRGSLGALVTDDPAIFLSKHDNMVLDGSDDFRAAFAREHLGYPRSKGLDFVAKFNNKYVIGEAKFLSDFGGSQNSDYEDAELTLRAELKPTGKTVIKIAIIDGVLYIDRCAGMQPANKLRANLNDDEVVLSSVLLRDYLYSL